MTEGKEDKKDQTEGVKKVKKPAEAQPQEAKQEESAKLRFPVKFILGKKVGMGRIFEDNGEVISVTFVEAGPCTVTQIKSEKTDGYNAVQLAFGSKKEKLITKPLAGHIKKSGLSSVRYLREIRIDRTTGIELGQEVKVDIFTKGDIVNVTAISKGLGFQGGVRRHHFKGGDKTHGQSDRLRAPGSIGQSSSPSRVFKGMRMAGRMGKDIVTQKNLKVAGVDADRNYLMIKGSIPGKPNNFVRISASQKIMMGS